MVLYSNISYLKKYNKNIPLSWDELLETGNYILQKEQQLNNNNIIGYNGFFPSNKYYNYLYKYINIY